MAFKFDLASYKDEFARNGYVLLKDALSDDLLDYFKQMHDRAARRALDERADRRIPGKMRQYVFDFPSKETADQFRAGMARLIGMNEEDVTISERHLKQYDEDAEEFPAPHKDRRASGISVGFPVLLAPETSVCVFPTLDRSENQATKAVFLSDNGTAGIGELYETKGVKLNEAVGDIVVFHGSSMFHARIKPRGSAVLYIKLNDRGEDPLGENIFAGSA